MKAFRRTTPVALVALTATLAWVSQTSAGPPQSSVREFTYVTHRAPAPPLGGCTEPGDDDTKDAYDLALWKIDSTMNVTLSTDKVPSSVTAGFESALNSAIGKWEGTDFGDRFGTVTPQPVRPRQRLDGTNVVGFGKIGSAVGSTRFWIDTSTLDVVEFDVLLNSNYPWSTDTTGGSLEACSGTPGAFDVEAVLVHELGHPVGLEHVDNDRQTMQPVIGTGETRKRTLADGDTFGVNLKY